ncbi:MAG: Sporulation kinase E [Syntrophorhabdus sp. PtaU1.Bin058]|nr:MAG: Sporulation kinase E [Syntrophorhabdus sp. PtaU1.Bin058]
MPQYKKSTINEKPNAGKKKNRNKIKKLPLRIKKRQRSTSTTGKSGKVFVGKEDITKKVLNAANIPIFLTDIKGRYFYVNKTFEALMGYSNSEVTGKTAHELKMFTDEEQCRILHQEIIEKGFVYGTEILLRVKSGEVRNYLMSFQVVQEINNVFIVGTAFDVTGHKRAREDLLESEEKVRALLNATTEAALLVTTEGIITIANETAAQTLKLPLEELLGRSIYDLMSGEASERRRKWIQEITKNKKIGIFEDEMEGHFIEHSVYPVLNNRNKVTMIAIFARDITKRRHAEEQLKESEERFRSLVEESPFAIHIARNGIILFSNVTSMKMFGYGKRSEIVGRPILDIVAPQCRDDVWDKTIRRESGEGIINSYETTGLRKDGSEFPMQVTVKLLSMAEGTADIVFFEDLTLRKLIEEELIKVRNLESIGTLAGGIAHDFNNLLMGVTGYVELARMQASPESKVYSYLTEAEKIADHGKELTQQLITFSQGGEPLKKEVKITPVLKSVSRFTLSGSNVKCEFLFPGNLNTIEADEAQLRQVIHNIILNAKEAMPKGGTITIRAENAMVTGEDIVPVSPGDYVKVAIEDKGAGIAPENIPKVFDPYFSTKDMGIQKGMGLGLAIAYSIVKKHNGHIIVESVPDKGTSFIVYLPVYVKRPEASEKTESVPAQKKRILFMDDEVFIRTIGNEILAHLGYDVTLTQDGNETILVYKQEKRAGRPFDVVILDLTMKGGIGGKDVLREILSVDPDAKAIISSGYTDDPVLSDYVSFGFRGAITKPYNINQLQEVLREVMSRKR